MKTFSLFANLLVVVALCAASVEAKSQSKAKLQKRMDTCSVNKVVIVKKLKGLTANIRTALDVADETGMMPNATLLTDGEVCNNIELRKVLPFQGEESVAPDYKGTRTAEDAQCEPNSAGRQSCEISQAAKDFANDGGTVQEGAERRCRQYEAERS